MSTHETVCFAACKQTLMRLLETQAIARGSPKEGRGQEREISVALKLDFVRAHPVTLRRPQSMGRARRALPGV